MLHRAVTAALQCLQEYQRERCGPRAFLSRPHAFLTFLSSRLLSHLPFPFSHLPSPIYHLPSTSIIPISHLPSPPRSYDLLFIDQAARDRFEDASPEGLALKELAEEMKVRAAMLCYVRLYYVGLG